MRSAQISCELKKYEKALERVERSLSRNTNNILVGSLKSVLLRKLGGIEESMTCYLESLRMDIVDCGVEKE